MSGWLIVLVGLVYAGIAIEQLVKHNWPGVIVYTCYSLSNVGLYWGLIR